MAQFLNEHELDNAFAAIREMLHELKEANVLKLLENVSPYVKQSGYDNWNGGTYLWTIYIPIPPRDFARQKDQLSEIENKIKELLETIISSHTEDWFSVEITPDTSRQVRKTNKNSISVKVRKNIFDSMVIEQVAWSGKLEQIAFLSRLYDLSKFPSFDNRFKDALGDISQHTVNNDDWEADWIYSDSRFDLMNVGDDTFLDFLCEMVHPVVRPNQSETLMLVSHFNDQLSQTGWKLAQVEKIAGRARYAGVKVHNSTQGIVSRAQVVADLLDADWMYRQITRAENDIETDPASAIGTAKELIETCCKTILRNKNVSYSKDASIGQLTKLITKELKLVPKEVAEEKRGAETIKSVLGNLAAITQGVSELRNLYGSGHGKEGGYVGLQPRHARLVVGAAITFVDFITATYNLNLDGKE